MPHERVRHGLVGLHRKDVLVDIVKQHPNRSVAVHLPSLDMSSQAVVEGLHLMCPPATLRYKDIPPFNGSIRVKFEACYQAEWLIGFIWWAFLRGWER